MPSNNLSELRGTYNIFGGPSNVSLYAERLSADFPTLVASDRQLVLKILEMLYTGFREKFQNCRYQTFQAIVFEHVNIVDGQTASDFLRKYTVASVENAFGEEATVNLPGVRFGALDKAGAWRLLCTVEKSEAVANGLFGNLDVTFQNMSEDDEFQTWLDRYSHIVESCSTALELEWNNAN